MSRTVYYIKAKGEHVEGFTPLSTQSLDDAQCRSVRSLVHERACRAIDWNRLLLSARAKNSLERSHFHSLHDIITLTHRQVQNIDKAGAKVRHEIYTTILQETGINLPAFR